MKTFGDGKTQGLQSMILFIELFDNVKYFVFLHLHQDM